MLEVDRTTEKKGSSMTNELQVFENNQFGQVRAIMKDGEPWFVAADVCNVFGETNRNRAMQSLDDDEKGYTQIDTPGGEQKMSIINESGLYALLFAMQPQKARGVTDEHIEKRQNMLRAFKRWVTHDVIPSIRKTGAYMTPETIEKVLMNPDTIISLATQLKELQTKVEQDKPKVLFADAVAASQTSILIGDLAKLIRQNGVEVGQNRLFQWLRDNGYLCSTGERYNLPTQKSMELKLFEVKETTISNPDGSIRITRTTKVTGKGQAYFVNKFLAS